MTDKLTAANVREILAILEASTFDELLLETEGLKLTLRRNGAIGEARPAPVVVSERAAPMPALTPTPPAREAGLVTVAAPMLGVYYRAPKPGAEPFVQVGARVAADTIIGLIEVMKLMNAVPAGVAGEVVEIVAGDGGLVEYGQAILRIRPD
jgi:acetyl-CoA carboxylase biotin carboxyl carrier protein